MKCPKCNARTKVILHKQLTYRECKQCAYTFKVRNPEETRTLIHHKWSERELDKLVCLHQKKVSQVDLAKKLNRSKQSVINKIYYLRQTNKYNEVLERVEQREMSKV